MIKTIAFNAYARRPQLTVGEVIPIAKIPPHTRTMYCHVDPFGNVEIEVEIPDDGEDLKVENQCRFLR